MSLSQKIRRISKDLVAGSYDDFLTNYSDEIKTAVNQLREMSKKYDDFISSYGSEDKFGEMIDNTLGNYDKNVPDMIDSWMSRHETISINDIVSSAIRNQDRFGTEKQMILYAIEEVYNEFKDQGL